MGNPRVAANTTLRWRRLQGRRGEALPSDACSLSASLENLLVASHHPKEPTSSSSVLAKAGDGDSGETLQEEQWARAKGM